MQVIPFPLLLNALSKIPHEDGCLVIPMRLLRFFLEQAVEKSQIDEEEYVRKNPDVAVAIRKGEYQNAKEHYCKYGYFEGRAGTPFDISETWYLRANPDVAAAVQAGIWVSGLNHFLVEGMFEWRSPNSDVAADLEFWRRLVSVTEEEVEETSPHEGGQST
jgi:hypothetical protein